MPPNLKVKPKPKPVPETGTPPRKRANSHGSAGHNRSLFRRAADRDPDEVVRLAQAEYANRLEPLFAREAGPLRLVLDAVQAAGELSRALAVGSREDVDACRDTLREVEAELTAATGLPLSACALLQALLHGLFPDLYADAGSTPLPEAASDSIRVRGDGRGETPDERRAAVRTEKVAAGGVPLVERAAGDKRVKRAADRDAAIRARETATFAALAEQEKRRPAGLIPPKGGVRVGRAGVAVLLEHLQAERRAG